MKKGSSHGRVHIRIFLSGSNFFNKLVSAVNVLLSQDAENAILTNAQCTILCKSKYQCFKEKTISPYHK